MAEFFPIAVDAPLDFGGVVMPAFFVREFGADRQLADRGSNVINAGGSSHRFGVPDAAGT
jgi:hypothetical protein